MWALYLEMLVFMNGLVNLMVLLLALAQGRSLTIQDFALPTVIQILGVSLVFLTMAIVRRHDARIRARVLVQHAGTQLADFKRALHRFMQDEQNFSRGPRTWNS